MAPGEPVDRSAWFAAFGRFVQSFEGRYITAEDVGVTTDDMRVVRRETPHVSGLPRSGQFGGDPSPMTALGVFLSIDAAVRRHLRRPSVAGTTVAVQGLGAVGAELCALLDDAGCSLVVADIDPARADRIRQRYGAKVVEVSEILEAPADVFAPCALGAVLDSDSIPKLNSSIVAGAANNQLHTAADGDRLQARGILYLPDFLVNAGGIISVAREFLGQADAASVRSEVARIGLRAMELMERSERSSASTALLAEQWARSKLH
jgi:leucine dehydrogenase